MRTHIIMVTDTEPEPEPGENINMNILRRGTTRSSKIFEDEGVSVSMYQHVHRIFAPLVIFDFGGVDVSQRFMSVSISIAATSTVV